MKTKIVSGGAALVLCFAVSAAAQTTCQYVTLASINGSGSTNYRVQTNQIITLVGYDWYGKATVFGSFPNGTTTSITPVYSVVNGTNTFTATPLGTQIFTGLTNIGVAGVGTGGDTPSATFKIETPAIAAVVSNYVPADAVVIPASATGNVQIILESSPDLVNWTAANPGTYGASAGTNRFFRVRAAIGP
jgi:hypothetical protein